MNTQQSNFTFFKASLTICLLIHLEAKAQTIPNGSFENWTQQTPGAQTVLTADNWVGSYSQGSTPLSPIRTTEHVDGNYGIELETTQWPIVGKTGAIVACTFPVATKPSYINGYFKSLRVDTTGAGQVLIRLTNNGTIIGSGLFTANTTVGTYTQFSQTISYTSNLIPDQATIWLCSEGVFGVTTKNFGNKLWIDKLSLTDVPLATDNNIDNADFFSIFPNPSSDILHIKLKNHKTASLKITNTIGQNVMSKELDNENNIISVAGLNSGVYFVMVEISNKVFTKKIIKE